MAKRLKLNKRTCGGRRKAQPSGTDYGTPEIQMRRILAVGVQRPQWPKPDLTDAVWPLGRYLWQGYLHGEFDMAKRMYEAGKLFASWWTVVYPKCHAQGTLGHLQPGGGATDFEPAEAEACLAAASAYLKKEARVLHTVIDVCVYQNPNHRHLDKLRTGLCRLMEWTRGAEAAEIRKRFDLGAAAE